MWLREGALPLATGIGMGLLYFAGLWWTSRRVARIGQPEMFLLASFAVRAALLLGSLWLVTGGRPVGTALFMAGFLISRRFMLARAVPPPGAGARTGAGTAEAGSGAESGFRSASGGEGR